MARPPHRRVRTRETREPALRRLEETLEAGDWLLTGLQASLVVGTATGDGGGEEEGGEGSGGVGDEGETQKSMSAKAFAGASPVLLSVHRRLAAPANASPQSVVDAVDDDTEAGAESAMYEWQIVALDAVSAAIYVWPGWENGGPTAGGKSSRSPTGASAAGEISGDCFSVPLGG